MPTNPSDFFYDLSMGKFRPEVDSADTNKILTGTGTLNFGSVGAGVAATATITVTGAAVGDWVYACPVATGFNDNFCFAAKVTADNTVTVTVANNTAGALDPDGAGLAWRAVVMRF